MTAASLPAIVFDFGGVLFDWDPRYLYVKLFQGDQEAAERFLNEIDFFRWNHQQDAGRSFAEAVAELTARFPQYAGLIRAYDERYEESLSGAIEPSLAVLEALAQTGYPLYGLTNWPEEKFRIVRRKFPFLRVFQDIVVSGEVGLAKPDPRIFHLLLQRTGRAAEACVYIDDSAVNLETAQALGFQCILFQNAQQLTTDLRAAGVVVRIATNGGRAA
jgi:2-haloacid dehalogenase